MKLTMMLAALILTASGAHAQECNRFTSDMRPPGEVTVEIKDDRELTMADQFGPTTVYDLISAGTGIAFMEGVPRGGGDHIQVLEHAGDMIIDMAIFTPYCQ